MKNSQRGAVSMDTLAQNERRAVYYLIIGAIFAAALLLAGITDRVVNYTIVPVTIRVQNSLQLTAKEELLKTMRPLLRKGVIFSSIKNIKNSLEALPSIDEVNIRRRWPDVLELYIKESRPVALWQDCCLLNERGQVIALEAHVDYSHLIKLSSATQSPLHMLAMVNRLQPILQKNDLPLQELINRHNQNWEIILSSGVKIILEQRDLLDKLSQITDFINKLNATKKGQIVSIDARYPDGLAIRINTTFKKQQKTIVSVAP